MSGYLGYTGLWEKSMVVTDGALIGMNGGRGRLMDGVWDGSLGCRSVCGRAKLSSSCRAVPWNLLTLRRRPRLPEVCAVRTNPFAERDPQHPFNPVQRSLFIRCLRYLRPARLVLRWATVSEFNYRCRTLISSCNQPATQGHLSLSSLRGR